MKALLYKDFLLLWRSHRSVLLWVALLAVLSFRVLDGALAAFHGTFLLLALLLVPADLNAHWLEVLPLSPGARVWSKYLLLWLLEGVYYLLVCLASLVSPSAVVTQRVLVTFLVYWAIALALQAVFFPILSIYGTGSKGAYSAFFACAFVAYFLGLLPLSLVRAAPLAAAQVLPYVGILFAASALSAPLAVSQYQKERR